MSQDSALTTDPADLPQLLPHGLWHSPLSAEQVAEASTRIGGLAVTPEAVFWGERRPAEGGRTAIVELARDAEQPADRLPEPWNVRSRAHEYGGGAFTAHRRTLFFSHFDDGCIYRQEPDAEPRPLTPSTQSEAGHQIAYADLLHDARRGRLLAVREAHRSKAEPEASLVSIASQPPESDEPQTPTVLVEGADFYSSPALSPDGALLAWLTWSHPRMPWDGTELWVAALDSSGTPTAPRRIAGGAAESIFQPGFDDSGNLVFVSDRSGWWNLYRVERDGLERNSQVEVTPLAPMRAEFGRPQWIFGMTTWAAAAADRLAAACTRAGLWSLLEVSSEDEEPAELELPYTHIEEVHSVGDGRVIVVASSPLQASAVIEVELGSADAPATDPREPQLEQRRKHVKHRVLSRSTPPPLEEGEIAIGEPIRFPSADGREAHAFFYAPRSLTCRAPRSDRPPLIVKTHGGPTAATDNSFDPAIQFWTTRGFAVVDVNYGGSTGYGRAYRELLQGRWGVVDVEDCVAAADFLSQRNEVDAERRAIRGGSAGGYTTLAALAYTDAFQAGASHYGIGDLEALARDTHKFESRYLDGLIGPYPERRDLYQERSPLHAADDIRCPVIFFQGLDDKVVPPNQAEAMVEALRAKGLPARLVTFEGEGHGFRRAENIAEALRRELAFYREVFELGEAGRDPEPTAEEPSLDR